MKISTNFLISKEDTIILPFDKKQSNSFNYLAFADKDLVTNDRAFLYKEKSNSMGIAIQTQGVALIEELKITNQNILTWDDLWIDAESSYSVDPKIESINLQRNDLLYVNFNLKREFLKSINLEGNYNLKSFIATDLPNLEVVNLDNCVELDYINLGLSKNIGILSLKNCRLTEKAMERTLSSFIPSVTASANIAPGTLPPFRKVYKTLLDLRGNDINWGNTRIASKIRLLVTNNWLVLWDNPPPTSVIPIQMYAFFPKNIKETEIYQYYGRPSI
jgi:hypothetical protein